MKKMIDDLLRIWSIDSKHLIQEIYKIINNVAKRDERHLNQTKDEYDNMLELGMLDYNFDTLYINRKLEKNIFRLIDNHYQYDVPEGIDNFTIISSYEIFVRRITIEGNNSYLVTCPAAWNRKLPWKLKVTSERITKIYN